MLSFSIARHSGKCKRAIRIKQHQLVIERCLLSIAMHYVRVKCKRAPSRCIQTKFHFAIGDAPDRIVKRPMQNVNNVVYRPEFLLRAFESYRPPLTVVA
jgi:hypothetical protein